MYELYLPSFPFALSRYMEDLFANLIDFTVIFIFQPLIKKD